MTLLSRSMLCMALCLPFVEAHAQVSPAIAEQLVRKSGMWEQLDGLATQIKQGFAAGLHQAGKAPDQADIGRIHAVIDTAYAAPRLRNVGLATVAAELDDRHVQPLQHWFDSATGKTITRLEEASASREVDAMTFLREGQALLQTMPEGRRALLTELAAVTRTNEAMVDILISATLAMQGGMMGIQPGQSHSREALQSQLEAQRPQMLAAYSAVSMAGFAKVYATLPDDQLAQYVAFFKTDAGRHFNDVVLEGLQRALTSATTEFLEAIVAPPGKTTHRG